MIENGYLLAWITYLLSAVVLMVVLWRITISVRFTEIRWLVLICLAAVLLTPAKVMPDQALLAPAFMAAIMELLSDDPVAASARLTPIIVVMLILQVISALVHLILRRRRKGQPD